METTRIIRSLSLLALLVLVLSVSGAFADGVTSQYGDTLVAPNAVQTLRAVQINRIPNSYLSPTSLATLVPAPLPGGLVAALIPNPPPPISATPEPGTAYLFMLGAGLILFSLRRRAVRS